MPTQRQPTKGASEMYQPNNGMTPEEFQTWLNTMPKGSKPLKVGTRKYATTTRRKYEKTVRKRSSDGTRWVYSNVLR